MKILLAEDDQTLHKSVLAGLKKLGYAVDSAFDGEQALEQYEVNSYDAVVLDLNLPLVGGMHVLRKIRSADASVKILILSARCEIDDKIQGLDGGANDYMSKPFHFRELEARLRALIYRKFEQVGTVIAHEELRLDAARKAVFLGGSQVELTRKEYGILEYLLLHKERPVGMEELIEHVWDSETDLFSNTFKAHVSSLRHKLSAAAGGKEFIETVRGVGYRLAEAPHGET
ncbi:MAG TPA: response regulator transcription factor [Clostridia bacterium]|nr:response regulator transcription factor [Clostridia bacterium]